MISGAQQHNIIDAKGQKLGRVASHAAALLLGKNTPEFRRNRVPQVIVTVKNAGALSIGSKKQKANKYVSYSGYPGGIKRLSLKELTERKGIASVVRDTVNGMLPKNKLQKRFIRNLRIIP